MGDSSATIKYIYIFRQNLSSQKNLLITPLLPYEFEGVLFDDYWQKTIYYTHHIGVAFLQYEFEGIFLETHKTHWYGFYAV